MRKDRVERLTAEAGGPLGPVGVVPERALELERLAPVVGSEHGARLGAGVDDAVAHPGRELPDPLQRGAGVLGEPDRAVGALGPGAAEVVGALDLRAHPARRGADQQPWAAPPGVDQAGVDLLHVEVRAGELPLAALLVGASDPQPLAGADQQDRAVHVSSSVLPRVCSVPPTVARARMCSRDMDRGCAWESSEVGRLRGMSACAEPLSVAPEPEDGLALRFYEVTSADGTVLRAWTNDADGPVAAALQRPRHQPLRLAGAARPRLRRPRDLVEPPRRRRLRAADGPGPGRARRSSSRTPSPCSTTPASSPVRWPGGRSA